MKPSFVIDASVIIAWYSPTEDSSYAEDILDCLRQEIAITPPLCCMEVCNVMRGLEKRGRITRFDVEKAIANIDSLPIIRDNSPLNFEMPFVLSLSREYDLTIYDACYLELALRLGLPLATLDRKLMEAVGRADGSLKTAQA